MTREERIVAEARRWIGTPYRHGASVRGIGCDCLGLVRGVWRAVCGPEPETPPAYSATWAEAGTRETLRDAARRHLIEIEPEAAGAGDVLLFRWRDGMAMKHAGIVTGEGRMIHAHDGACVAEVAFGIWRRRIAAAFRFPGPLDAGDAADAAQEAS